jgi:hypothetical protein
MGPSDIMVPLAVTIALRNSAAIFLAFTAGATTSCGRQIASRARAMMAVVCGVFVTPGEALQRLNRLPAAAH